jgi:signal transduction histidine kinase
MERTKRLLVISLLFFSLGASGQSTSPGGSGASELLVEVREQLKYPDSALHVLNMVDPTGWSDSLISEYYRLKGSAFFYKGIRDSAIVYFSSAMGMVKADSCDPHFALVSNGMGVVLQAGQLYDQAIDAYLAALICAEVQGDKQLKLKLYVNLGILHREVGNLKESDRFIDKSYALAKEMDDQRSLAAVLNSRGQNYLVKEVYDSAYVAFTQSLAFRPDDDKKGKAISLNNLGYVAGLREDFEEALEYYRLSEDLRKAVGDLAGSASLYINMGNIYLLTNDLESAQQYYDNAKIIGDQLNDPSVEERYLRSMANLRERQGKLKESHAFLTQFIDLRDSINEYESIHKIASTPYQMALTEAENKVRFIQKEKAERDASLERQRLINLGLAIGIAVVIGLLALFLYQLRMLINLRRTLTEERDQAKHAAEHRRRTLNTIVHELRTPMNTVIALSELIEQEKDAKEVRKMTQLLSKSAQRLSTTTNNVLTFSRLEDGTLVLADQPVNLSELINDLCNMLAPQVQSKSLLLERDIQKGVIIHSDRSALDICFMNLMGNALKYTDQGAIYVGMKKQAEQIEITVKDTGIGISKEALEKVFEPFYRAKEKRSTRQGTGLGLYICKYYVDALGGDIQVESEPDVGTSLSITLPIKQSSY